MLSDNTPFYSSIKNIFLKNDVNLSFNILLKNDECQFERIELLESINELIPNGTIIVRDTKDIISFIKNNNIVTAQLEFSNGTYANLSITSVTHITNAASDTEENFISINVSNYLYKYMQSSSLLDTMPYYGPQVYKTDEFVKYAASILNTTALIDKPTTNYILYKPFNTIEERIEYANTNPIQYLNYISDFATGKSNVDGTPKPRYKFWTNWLGQLVMKYFEEYPDYDILSSDKILNDKVYRFAIYDSDAPTLSMRSAGNKLFRKIYYLNSDPAEQFISKNYFYIRKTPKILDKFPSGITMYADYYAYLMKALMYQYSDEGEKYNIELISSNKTDNMKLGADQLKYDSIWGHYNSYLKPSDDGVLTLLGKDLGSAKQYNALSINGYSGYFPFVDTPDMWKMMFDFTEIHPNFPDNDSLLDASITGASSYLQTVMDIRYEVFKQNQLSKDQRLETFRKIERENFITYVLCCMAKEEECFFAALSRYEVDNTYGAGLTGYDSFYNEILGGVRGLTSTPFRYKWVKLNFNSTYGDTGPLNYQGTGGTAYFAHNIESWSEDFLIRANETQDETWAINLNERSIGKKYLPPGWVTPLPQGFKWRPIGKTNTQTSVGDTSGSIWHIVKMCRVPISDLLLDSRQLVPSNYIGKYVYYFTAENIVDGTCQ